MVLLSSFSKMILCLKVNNFLRVFIWMLVRVDLVRLFLMLILLIGAV